MKFKDIKQAAIGLAIGLAIGVVVLFLGRTPADHIKFPFTSPQFNFDVLRAQLTDVEEGDFIEFKGQLVAVRTNRYREDSTGAVFVLPLANTVFAVYPSIDSHIAQVGKIYRRAKQPDNSFTGNVNPAWSEAAYRFVTQ